jgi:hypothetical protein
MSLGCHLTEALVPAGYAVLLLGAGLGSMKDARSAGSQKQSANSFFRTHVPSMNRIQSG